MATKFYPAWLDRLESFDYADMPDSVWDALSDSLFNLDFSVERFLDVVAEFGFRRDMKWLTENGIIAGYSMYVYQLSKAVNVL